jgi:hypothetical protein
MEERGCALIYLPPSEAPPDLNPIEEAFPKIKWFSRELRARVRGALVEAIGRAHEAISAWDAESSFDHCGYRMLAQQLCQALQEVREVRGCNHKMCHLVDIIQD